MSEYFSQPRRDLLWKGLTTLTGAAAFAATTLHSSVLKALDLPKGTKWAEGVRLMRKSSMEDPDEHLATFLGDKADGEWIHSLKGTATMIFETQASIGKRVLEVERGAVGRIERGIVVDHTHTAQVVKSFLSDWIEKVPDLKATQLRSAFTFLTSPSALDLLTASRTLTASYFAMAGIKVGPVESGVVGPDGRWQINHVQWTSAQKAAYPTLYAKHVAREEKFKSTYTKLQGILRHHTEAVREAYDLRLKADWDKVAKTDAQKRDAVILSLLNRALNLADLKILNVLERPEHDALMQDVVSLLQINELLEIEEEYEKLVEKLLKGDIDLKAAIKDFSSTTVNKLGIMVTYTPHP